MTDEYLQILISEATQIGCMEAMKAYEPSADLLRTRDVKSWLGVMHVSMKKFKWLKENGYVRIIRKGTAKNSPIYYSKTEIKKALFHARASMIKELDKHNINTKIV